jgi:predicted transcriptional regulator
MTARRQDDMIALTSKVVTAYAAGNTLPAQALPDLIRAVHAAFVRLATGSLEAHAEDITVPAVPITRSVFPDYIICLEDGKRLKTLRRHLQTAYGMTPEQYRRRWNLPGNYPMTASNYATRRSDLAKQNGFGQRTKPTEASGDEVMSAKDNITAETTLGSTKAAVIKTRPHSKKKTALPIEA